ncbi:hypothetical protein BO85DRAFT_484839 [Aspergillus piperis CBS 112811]|uniref:SnoaL-like domain-containing protein n=1 Tax=Aspergillus piperis CBS 112811 TaxID=1448313 RepID=A0A8G1R7S3_9EURO|nr:hypothetical protein BO85DRAFT_484839 [Aspergillus piperis CBS 112811]RAH61089.1 hypothetical protein BO85DRAFT_484839 [Aspergillus piperis CBS 112811]
MSSMIVNGRYPPVNGSTLNDVTSEERSSAIDFVNRHNFVFEEFDHAKMIDTFLQNATVYHSHGTISEHKQMKEFFEKIYGFFIPGISRSATNHIVDRDEDGGVIVRYQEMLIRYGWPGDDTAGFTRKDVVRENGLPAIWWIGTIIDRLRMTSSGWKIHERYLGTPFRNGALDLDRAPERVSSV